MIRSRHLLRSGLLAVAITLSSLGVAAAQSSSTHYQVNQVFFGSGGVLGSSSADYEAQEALGELVEGNEKSTNYQAYGGFNTTSTPLLELNVSGGNFNFGSLTNSATSSINTTFSVRNYVSNGYGVYVTGTAPTTGPSSLNQHTLATISSLGCAVPGQEQFGINLAANTTSTQNGCTAVNSGSVPQQVPNNSFSFGQTTSNYGTANKFMFNPGDEVAYSNSSTGETIYTLTAIANISTITPADHYAASMYLVVAPTF